MLQIAKTVTKLTAIAILLVGGTLAGLLGGWNMGPLTLNVSRAELGWVGAGAGLLLAGFGCYFALERAEAIARKRMQGVVVQRLLGMPPR
jgi:hypothetical protein